MRYVKIEVIELPEKQVAQWETAFALAACPDFNYSEMREEVLQKICSENPEIKALIEKFRRENQ